MLELYCIKRYCEGEVNVFCACRKHRVLSSKESQTQSDEDMEKQDNKVKENTSPLGSAKKRVGKVHYLKLQSYSKTP